MDYILTMMMIIIQGMGYIIYLEWEHFTKEPSEELGHGSGWERQPKMVYHLWPPHELESRWANPMAGYKGWEWKATGDKLKK